MGILFFLINCFNCMYYNKMRKYVNVKKYTFFKCNVVIIFFLTKTLSIWLPILALQQIFSFQGGISTPWPPPSLEDMGPPFLPVSSTKTFLSQMTLLIAMLYLYFSLLLYYYLLFFHARANIALLLWYFRDLFHTTFSYGGHGEVGWVNWSSFSYLIPKCFLIIWEI